MHGQQNIKICDEKQTNQVPQYKNTKIKLCKCKAAIWYNKTYRIKHLAEPPLNLCTGRPPTECGDI